MAFGVRTNCLSSFPPFTGQKWKFFNIFFDILGTPAHTVEAGVRHCTEQPLSGWHPKKATQVCLME